MGYRERCYGTFVSKHSGYYHNFSAKDYDLRAIIYSKRFKNVIPADKGAAILDVACGAGHFLYFLKKEGYTSIRGIDFSAEQLEVSSRMGINVEMADLFEFLPSHLEKFDLIAAFDIIEHFTKDEVIKFLDAIHGSLRPGGMVLIGTVNAASLMAASTVFGDFTHETVFTPQNLAQVLRVCDFEVEVFAEKPIPHDFKSAVRACLWSVCKMITKLYIMIERGSGRGMYNNDIMLEPKMFALAKKPDI